MWDHSFFYHKSQILQCIMCLLCVYIAHAFQLFYTNILLYSLAEINKSYFTRKWYAWIWLCNFLYMLVYTNLIHVLNIFMYIPLFYLESVCLAPKLHGALFLKNNNNNKIWRKNTHEHWDVYSISVKFHDQILFCVVHIINKIITLIVNSTCARKRWFYCVVWTSTNFIVKLYEM